VYFRNDITGRDESQWALTHILYADEIYSSIDEFRAAWQSPDFKKMTVNKLGDWIDVKNTGEELPLESLAPPQEVLTSGQRFKVDEEEKYVEWMDFTFFITYVHPLRQGVCSSGADRS
jgi:primary-amine oxidase